MDERLPVTDVRFSTDGARIIAHDERLNTFVFDAKGGPDPLLGKGKLMGVADDGRTAVVEVTPNVYRTAQVGSRDDPTTKKLDLGGRYINIRLRRTTMGNYNGTPGSRSPRTGRSWPCSTPTARCTCSIQRRARRSARR